MLGAEVRALVTFSGSKYDETTRRIVQDGLRFGADRVDVYDDVWLSAHPFFELNRWIFDHPGDRNGKRGFGWYSWKPLVILDALSRCKPGDSVAYVDADTVPIAPLHVLWETAERDGAMLFKAQTHKNFRWCKRDTYYVMGLGGSFGDESPDAGVARFMAFAAGQYKPQQFLWEWLTYAVNRLATTFDASTLGPEVGGFEEHRTEQAILTLLAHRYGYKLHRECDESGEESQEDRDLYPQLFQQIRQGSCDNGPGSRFRNV